MHEELTATGFARLVAAGTPLLHITTGNEARTEALLAQAAQALREMPAPLVWDCLGGFPGQPGTAEPLAALRWATEREGRGIFLFKDLHWFWRDSPPLQRLLRAFAGGRSRPGKSFVFLGAAAVLPPALAGEFVLLEHELPGREEIHAWFEARRQQDPWLRQQLAGASDLAHLVVAGQGLDLPEIERALRLARVTPGEGTAELIAALHQGKKQRLRRSGIMEFVDNDVLPEHLGGMENLKAWMEKRERAFGPAGFAAGPGQPKGVLLMGVSGCGKSLFVKAIAARWRLPLVRLDMATVYEGTFGSPEASLRQACRTAESLAPCVLWIDEMEAGITTHGFKADGGSASRVLGYFLTWMQEKRRPVFVAATANAIEMLPAEVLRKGRFDEIFYIALPAVAEREEIFRIHLRRRGFDPERYAPAMLAHSAKGFSGAEIEQAVESASFEAFAQQRPLTQQDLMEAISRTVPLSVTMAEQIKRIEAWAFKRAVPASKGG
jgi:vesicle-fusing ATPase